MLIGYVGSSDNTPSTNNANGSAPANTPTPQTSNAQALQEKYGNLTRFVCEYAAYQPAGSSTPTPSAPRPKSGSDQSSSSNPKVKAAVNNIFTAAANGSTPTQRELDFANALAGQPSNVVAAVRNDSRYRPLLNQFINATIGATGKPPASNDPEAAAKWQIQARGSLYKLTSWLTDHFSNSNALPPSIAADVVNSPRAQALFANLNQFTGTTAAADNTEFNFSCESQIADALGSTTPAAQQFTREMAKQIVTAVPPGQYSSYLDVKDALGAPASDGQQAPSPALAVAIAQQLQANGDSQDAQGIINDVCSAVNDLATSNTSGSVSVTKALSDYQQKTSDLNWLIANLGGGATQQQINTAINDYMKQQGTAWNTAYQQDKATLLASGQHLANDIAQLGNLPKDLQTHQNMSTVSSTLKNLAGNQSVQQAIGYALANDPVSIEGSDGEKGDTLAKAFELVKGSNEIAKGSNELATAIAQVYLKGQLEPELLSNLKGLTPGSPEYDAKIKTTLDTFMAQHKNMAMLAGLNDDSIAQLSTLLPKNAATPEVLKESIATNLETLEKENETHNHLLQSLGLAVGTYGFYSAINKAIGDPTVGNVAGTFTAALGFSQNAAALAGGLFENANPKIAAFGNEESALGDLAGKVINGANLVSNFQNLGTDLQDGNTVGAVGAGAGVAGTALALVPEELMADGLQGGVDIASDALTVASAVIGVGQLLFSGPPQPPSTADQLAFLKSEGFTGLSQNALFDLLPQSSNPSSDAPGSSPWKLLVKYAEDNHYNLGNSSQQTAFVNWVNDLAAHPAGDNTYGAIGPDGKPVDQLASLVQNLDAELDYSNGNVSNFPASNPVSDANFAKVAQANQLTDAFSGNVGPRGVVDNNWGISNDHVVTVNPHPSDAAVVAPQSAYQVDQLLQVIGGRPLPQPPEG